MRQVPFVLFVAVLAACGGSSDRVTGEKPEPGDPTPRAIVAGTVEKGPFTEGTVAISPAAGGAAVTTSIQDGLGTYLALVPAAPVHDLAAVGRPYRETSGTVGAEVTLTALSAGAGERAIVHVNVLTHLAHDRAARLAAAGTAWPDAIARADDEVHRALGVGVPFYTPSGPASARSMLGADDADHAYGFAVAAVIDRAAGDDLGGFLSTLAADLADDGTLAPELAARIAEARGAVDATRVTAALRAWLDRTGHADVIVPDLRRILDADGDGIPDREDELVLDAARVAIERHGLDRADEAVGTAGALSVGCPPGTVELFEREDALAPIATGRAAADGSFAVAFGTPESSRPRLWLEAADGCGARTTRVPIAAGADETPPALAVDALAIVRRGSEAPDGVVAAAGAVADDGVVAMLWILDADGTRLTGTVPEADGSCAELPVGTADASYPELWAQAVDKAGNALPPIAIEEGSAGEPPGVDPGAVVVNRRGIGEIDSVAGGPGALVGTCRPVEVQLAGQNGPFAVVPADPDGGFVETEFGTATQTPARLWLVPVDKCGRTGAAVELEAARDLEPPAIDPTRVRVLAGVHSNQADGLPGAVVDEHGVIEVRLYEADCGDYVGTVEVRTDGSFIAGSLASFTSSEARICVEAVDKAGNVSPRVRSRRVRALLDAQSFPFGGRPEVAFFGNVYDVDPRTVAPGYAAWASTRLGEQDRASLIQGAGVSIQAETEFREVPFAWRWLDLSLATPDVAAVAVPGPVVVRTMGDWPWMVTLARACTSAYCTTWRWDVAAVDGPPRREGMAVAAHPDAGLLAFGGTDGATRLADTWQFDGAIGGGWTQLPGAGGPAATAVRMVYDPVLGRPLLVAAVEGDPALQVWFFRFDETWARLNVPAGPSFRTGFAIAPDLAHGQVVLFGGRDATGTALGDTWTWDGTGWTRRTPVTSPSPRWGHGMVWRGLSNLVLLRGGSAAGALDGWTWDGTRWAHVDSDGSANGVGVAMVEEPASASSRLYTFYSSTPTGAAAPQFTVREEGYPTAAGDTFLGPTAGGGTVSWDPDLQEATLKAAVELPMPGGSSRWWSWQAGAWHQASGDEFVADARTVVVDTHRGLRLDLGRNDDGRGVAVDERGNRATFDLPPWPAGAVPAYVFDAQRGRTIGVAGGESWAIGAVDFDAWTAPLTRLSGGPTGAAELVFDPRRGVVVAFDGTGTWELDGDAWVSTAPAPAACPGGHLVFDPDAGKLLKLAGGSCTLACWYDGSWSCGAPQAPGPDLAGAPDLREAVLLAHGAGSRTWVREGVRPHARHAVLSWSARLPPDATPLAADIDVRALGYGYLGGWKSGFLLDAWDWAGGWIRLGSAYSAYPQTLGLASSLPSDPSRFFRDGRLSLQLTPMGSSGPDTGHRSDLLTTQWTVALEYLLPEATLPTSR